MHIHRSDHTVSLSLAAYVSTVATGYAEYPQIPKENLYESQEQDFFTDHTTFPMLSVTTPNYMCYIKF